MAYTRLKQKLNKLKNVLIYQKCTDWVNLMSQSPKLKLLLLKHNKKQEELKIQDYSPINSWYCSELNKVDKSSIFDTFILIIHPDE